MTTYRHGFIDGCPFGHGASRPADPGYRNIFGPAAPGEIYDGLGQGREVETQAMLLRLARHVVDVSANVDVHRGNDNIPAGYTYFAQFVGHDMVQTVIQPGQGGPRNFRQAGLMLDALYGGGPAVMPHCYAVPPPGGARVKLRLGAVRAASQKPGSDILPGRFEDLPRILPIALNDHAAEGPSDVLIADPRNDDNVILSQLTALFHRLHNKVYDLVWQKRAALFPGVGADEARCFALARAIVTLVYRRIVVSDLLWRLIRRPVYTRYFVDCAPDTLLDQGEDDRIPIEFSHAVFRVGHMMVRAAYDLNPELPNTGLLSLLMRVSSQDSRQLPLPENWIISWRSFFDERPANLSRLIGPSITSLLARDGNVILGGGPGGLLHADLLRGVEGGVRRVASLIDRLPPALRQQLGRLADPAGRRAAIRGWAAAGHSLDPADLAQIAEDPPLLLFVLLEAAEIEGGRSLGPLGSVIVAETFTRQLNRSAALFEQQETLVDAARQIFGISPPYDMPSLITFLGVA